MPVVDVDSFEWCSISGSGVGGNALFVGCEVKGPPPGVGGRVLLVIGDDGGVSSGGGMLVPAVREKLTGAMGCSASNVGCGCGLVDDILAVV